MPKYLTTTEAAQKAEYADSSTIRRAILNKHLKAVKRGHDWWIDEKDLNRWIAGGSRVYPKLS